jgi:hypothetical protein
VPKTLDSMREYDETTVRDDGATEEDSEVRFLRKWGGVDLKSVGIVVYYFSYCSVLSCYIFPLDYVFVKWGKGTVRVF